MNYDEDHFLQSIGSENDTRDLVDHITRPGDKQVPPELAQNYNPNANQTTQAKPVPRVVGMSIIDATTFLEQEGFRVEKGFVNPSAGIDLSTAPSGLVLAQLPQSGTQLSLGDTVIIRELPPSENSKDSSTPATSQSSIKNKKNTNSQKPLLWAVIFVTLLAGIGIVFYAYTQKEETPSATPSPTSSPTSTGVPTPTQPPRLIAVPNLEGKSPTEARAAITAAGLEIGEELLAIPPKENQLETIVQQAPTSKGAVPEKTKISFVIGATGKSTEVPNLIGMPEEVAQRQLTTEKFSTTPSQAVDSVAPKGKVIAQLPLPGSNTPGTNVLLYVSNGKRVVPDVVGLQEKQAVSNLVAKGFTVRVFEIINNSLPKGEVVSQSPLSNTYSDAKDPVSITVSTKNS